MSRIASPSCISAASSRPARRASVYARPRHPYTRALLDSVPKLRSTSSELVTFKPIQGELPSPLAPPPGCHFHLRCLHAQARCKADVPVLEAVADGRMAACHFPL